jgi:carbamoyltransferase
MKILGITDGMTGSAALIEDGKIRCAIHEERLIRKKMAMGFPSHAISEVLAMTNTPADEIDFVAIATLTEHFRKEAIAWDGWFKEDRGMVKEALLKLASVVPSVVGAKPIYRRFYYELKSLLGRRRRKALVNILRGEFGIQCPIEFVDHHFAHACSAYFTSGLRKATVITMDGAGDNSSSKVYLVQDGDFHQVCNIDSFDSIGNYYAYVTHLCGFKAHKHEGKITGLAAHGKPVYVDLFRRLISYQNGRIINTGNVFYWSALRAIKKALPESFRREDLACSMQQVLEEVGCQYVQYWVEKTGCGHLALAGGIFANVKLNQRIHELKNVETVFIHPSMGDGGLAVGAALALNARLSSSSDLEINSPKLSDVYFGPSYDDEEIKKEIQKEGLKAEYMEDIEKKIAQLLANGYVVARFEGAMEYGPRALGNRSILYQPTDPTVNDWLNRKLHRTEFMPFAPVTLVEYADRCYKNMDGGRYPAEFMTITFDCTDSMAESCPAVVHIDGTARPQIINKETNPGYYKIVDEYRKITGLPSIINTSFNMHEEPIVCTPHDAIRAFKLGHLDYLAIGNFLVSDRDNQSQN